MGKTSVSIYRDEYNAQINYEIDSEWKRWMIIERKYAEASEADIGRIHHRRLKHSGKLMDAAAERDFPAFAPNK